MNIKKFNSAEEISETVSQQLMEMINNKAVLNENFFLAVSGGSTPKVLFKRLSEAPYADGIIWKNLHIYWVDERCVPPEDDESNFGMTKKILLDNINIPEENIHRMRGEDDPNLEIHRYANEIKELVPFTNGLPQFDLIQLGMGADGHTASLFSNSELGDIADGICATAVHPVSGQRRVTLTQDVLNNAANVIFLVTGKDKKEVLKQIIDDEPGAGKYPASHINPSSGKIEWYVDEEAVES